MEINGVPLSIHIVILTDNLIELKIPIYIFSVCAFLLTVLLPKEASEQHSKYISVSLPKVLYSGKHYFG